MKARKNLNGRDYVFAKVVLSGKILTKDEKHSIIFLDNVSEKTERLCDCYVQYQRNIRLYGF